MHDVVRELAVHGPPDGVEAPQRAHGVDLEQRPAPARADAGGEGLRSHVEPDDQASRAHAATRLWLEHGAARDTDDRRYRAGKDRTERGAFFGPKGALAPLGEDLRDASSAAALHLRVAVAKGPAHMLGHDTADGRLARAHHADEENVLTHGRSPPHGGPGAAPGPK